MNAYYVGREVLPGLQLRALPPVAYCGTFAVRSTGPRQLLVCDGGAPAATRTADPAGSVVLERPYFDAGSSAVKLLRLRFDAAPGTLNVAGTGKRFCYLCVTLMPGGGGVAAWLDPVLGSCHVEAKYRLTETAMAAGTSGTAHLLIATVDAAENGTLTVRQQLHGEPHVMLAGAEEGENSEGASSSGDGGSSTCSVSLGSETSSETGSETSSETGSVTSSETGSVSLGSTGGGGGSEGGGSDGGSSTCSVSLGSESGGEESGSGESTSVTFDDNLFYVVNVVEYFEPDCQGEVQYDHGLEILQPPFHACQNYYSGEDIFIQSVSTRVVSQGFATYREAEIELERRLQE